MQLSLELRALGWAVLVALLSLGSAWLAAISLKAMPPSGAAPTAGAFLQIAVSPALVSQGRKFYGLSCAECHADDAHGDEGPDLHKLFISNARIAATIKKGIKGEMPKFGKKYKDEQIAALVSYLRSLGP